MKIDRVYAQIDLDAIIENVKAMQEKLAKGTAMYGVIKADAYGHGAVMVSKAMNPYVVGFAVATVSEALELRKSGITKEILVLAPSGEDWDADCIQSDITLTVWKMGRALKLSKTAAMLGKTAKIQIPVDTGMGRIGCFPDESARKEIFGISQLPGIQICGMFTHFARADEADKSDAMHQYRIFSDFCQKVKELGIEIPVCHCSNSAGILEMPEVHMDAVRAGIIVYGLYPSKEMKRDFPLKPAMSLKSFLTCIKEVPAGIPISYGGTFVSDTTIRVGTVSAGYGDGYPRGLSNEGHVLIGGKRAKILGRICMDQFMVDLSGIPEAKEGELVTLLGRDGEDEITMEELADLSGRFHYEIPCLIGKRVQRAYVKDGKRYWMRPEQ